MWVGFQSLYILSLPKPDLPLNPRVRPLNKRSVQKYRQACANNNTQKMSNSPTSSPRGTQPPTRNISLPEVQMRCACVNTYNILTNARQAADTGKNFAFPLMELILGTARFQGQKPINGNVVQNRVWVFSWDFMGSYLGNIAFHYGFSVFLSWYFRIRGGGRYF